VVHGRLVLDTRFQIEHEPLLGRGKGVGEKGDPCAHRALRECASSRLECFLVETVPTGSRILKKFLLLPRGVGRLPVSSYISPRPHCRATYLTITMRLLTAFLVLATAAAAQVASPGASSNGNGGRGLNGRTGKRLVLEIRRAHPAVWVLVCVTVTWSSRASAISRLFLGASRRRPRILWPRTLQCALRSTPPKIPPTLSRLTSPPPQSGGGWKTPWRPRMARAPTASRTTTRLAWTAAGSAAVRVTTRTRMTSTSLHRCHRCLPPNPPPSPHHPSR
jgi:hypothetical protein